MDQLWNQSIYIMPEVTTLSVHFHFLPLLDMRTLQNKFRWVTTQSRSPDGAVHHKVNCGASWELSYGALLHWRVDFDLPHVCVSAVLVVGKHCDLDHEGADWLVCPLRKEKLQV